MLIGQYPPIHIMQRAGAKNANLSRNRYSSDHGSMWPTQNGLAVVSSQEIHLKKAQWRTKKYSFFLSLPPACSYRGPAWVSVQARLSQKTFSFTESNLISFCLKNMCLIKYCDFLPVFSDFSGFLSHFCSKRPAACHLSGKVVWCWAPVLPQPYQAFLFALERELKGCQWQREQRKMTVFRFNLESNLKEIPLI